VCLLVTGGRTHQGISEGGEGTCSRASSCGGNHPTADGKVGGYVTHETRLVQPSSLGGRFCYNISWGEMLREKTLVKMSSELED